MRTTTATTDRALSQRKTPRSSLPRCLRMAGDASSLRDARHMVADALSEANGEVRDAIVLLAGEILTNAIVHGGGWFLLQVDAAPERVYVEVADSTPGQPTVLHPSSEREHGRGMAMVDALASAWGVEERGSHKAVWFELAIDQGGRPSPPGVRRRA